MCADCTILPYCAVSALINATSSSGVEMKAPMPWVLKLLFHFGCGEDCADVTGQLINDLCRSRSGRECPIPITHVEARQTRFGERWHIRQRGKPRLSCHGDRSHPSAADARHDRYRNREVHLDVPAGEIGNRGPSALVGDLLHLTSVIVPNRTQQDGPMCPRRRSRS